jgi:hypothetical protein
MKMRKAILCAAALTLCSDASAYVQRSGTARAGRSIPYCTGRSVGFFQLAAELNRVQSGCASLECYRAAWGNLENKELAGYTLSNWLWSAPSPKTFTVAELDAFVAAARARAQSMRPPTKAIRGIAFFTDFIVPSQGGGYFLGARATYGNCVPSPLPHLQN